MMWSAFFFSEISKYQLRPYQREHAKPYRSHLDDSVVFLSFWVRESFSLPCCLKKKKTLERCIFHLATAQCLSSTEPKLEWRATHSVHLPTSHLIALCVLGSDRTSSPATVLHNHLLIQTRTQAHVYTI